MVSIWHILSVCSLYFCYRHILRWNNTNSIYLSVLLIKLRSYIIRPMLPEEHVIYVMDIFLVCIYICIRYSDWLWPRCRSSSPGRGKIFLFSSLSRQVLGSTQPPIQWVLGALSPRVKRPGRETDHLPPISAKMKNTWIYTSTPPYTFMA
jgi:hypothetical protein